MQKIVLIGWAFLMVGYVLLYIAQEPEIAIFFFIVSFGTFIIKLLNLGIE